MENITIGEISNILGIISGMIISSGVIITFLLKRIKIQIDMNLDSALKPIHEELKEMKSALSEDKEEYIEGILCVLRNEILEMYCERKESQQITIQEKQAIKYSFDIYKKYGGNSFIEDIVKEMNTYKVLN